MQSIKLDNRTTQILKNFATINPSLLFKTGNKLTTMSATRSILSRATIAQTFESEFAIYDLSRFLGVMSLFNEPELLIEEKFMTIASGSKRLNYTFADPSTIITPPNKEIEVSNPDVKCALSAETFSDVMKAASLLKHPEIAFIGKDGELTISAIDSSGKSKDTYDVKIAETDKNFRLIIKVENLKFLPGNYEVSLTKGISLFKGDGIEYFIAIEHNSTFA